MATLDDLRQYGRDNYFDKADTKSERVLDRAANTGLRLLAQSHDWEWFNTVGRINTAEQQTSGTVAVSEDGAIVTLTGATWPTALTDYSIRINSSAVDFQFGTRNGDTTGTFVSGQTWNSADVATGTYVLYRSRYDLASDCRKFGELVPQDLDWFLAYLDKDMFERTKASDIYSTGDPNFYSHDNSYIYMWPPPYTKQAVIYNYQRWPETMTTGGDTADWPDNRIDALYGAMGVALDIHQKKVDWPTGMAMMKALVSMFSADEPKRDGNTSVQSMYRPETQKRFRLEWTDWA